MEDHGFAKLLKRKVESFQEKTRKNATKAFHEDKKTKRFSASWTVHSKSKPRHSSHGFKIERNHPGGSMKLQPNNEIKSCKQIDVKRGTLTTNLASTYFKTRAKTPIPFCASQNNPPRTSSTQKHKLKERVHKSRGSDNCRLAQADDKVCYVVKDVTKKNRKRKEDDSAHDDSNITYDTTDDTDVDMPSLEKETSYSRVQYENKNSQLKPKLENESRDNSKNQVENKQVPGIPIGIPDDSFKKHLINQECCTDTQKLLDSGTNPSTTLISCLYETNKLKNQKSSIPIKCLKSTNRSITDALQKIKFILEEVKELEDEISMFDGSSTDHRDYVYMEEVMMRNLIKLDNLETSNNEIVRIERKQAIQFIQSSMNRLQRKLIENQTNIDLDELSVSTVSTLGNAISKGKIRSSIRISGSR
ncbi:hypothetical protein FQR65_LT12003 [Abscondita terminalis]|nr:hypothetical protein FQR65_LT12003 [Abscondita terminalis]